MELIRTLLGIDLKPGELNSLHVTLRAIIIFMFGVLLIRVGHKRFLGRSTSLDALLAVMLGATLARAINGSAPFVPTLVAASVLTALHALGAKLSFYSAGFERLLKGDPVTLVRDGQRDEHGLRRTEFTPADLEASLRINGSIEQVEDVKLATLERNGSVSVVKRS